MPNNLVYQWSDKDFAEHVAHSTSWRSLQISLGYASGSSPKLAKKRVEELELDTSHFCIVKTNRSSPIWDIPIDQFKKIVDSATSWSDLGTKLGCNRRRCSSVIRTRIVIENIDTTHFTHKKYVNSGGYTRHTLEDIFANKVYMHSNPLKKRLLKAGLLNNICSVCEQKPWWNGKKLILQLDHINGDHEDNRFENLRMICGHCHSQTETFCSKKLRKAPNTCTDCNTNIGRQSKRCVKCYVNSKATKKSTTKTNLCTDCGSEICKDSKRCEPCYHKTIRKVERPSFEQLKQDIEELGYSGTGRKYGVSDNAIRKWLKNPEYNLDAVVIKSAFAAKNTCKDCGCRVMRTSTRCKLCHLDYIAKK